MRAPENFAIGGEMTSAWRKSILWIGSILAAFAAGWLISYMNWLFPPGSSLHEKVFGREECFRVRAAGSKFDHKYCINTKSLNCGLKHEGITRGLLDADFLHVFECTDDRVVFVGMTGLEDKNSNVYWWKSTFKILESDRSKLEGHFRDSNNSEGDLEGQKL